MVTLKIITAIIALCLVQKTSSIKFEENWITAVGKKFDVFFNRAVKHGRISHVACELRVKQPNARRCYVYSKNYFNENEEYACAVDLKTFDDDVITEYDYSVQNFQNDKLVLLWEGDGTYVMLSVIQFPNCNVTTVKIDGVACVASVFEIPYLNTFEVFFNYPKFCRNQLCRMTFNSDGQVIEWPVGFIDNSNPFIIAIKPISDMSADRGFFVVRTGLEGSQYILINSGGEPNVITDQLGHRGLAVSTRHDFITVCSYYKSQIEIINCTRYNDMNGKVKFETSTVIDTNRTDIHPDIRVYNLREGSFLLIYADDSDMQYTRFQFMKIPATQYLIKFDSEGNQIGKSVMEKTSLSTWIDFFENENGDYCLLKNYDSVSHEDHFYKYNLTHECYDNSMNLKIESLKIQERRNNSTLLMEDDYDIRLMYTLLSDKF